jgi:hypothetical protein
MKQVGPPGPQPFSCRGFCNFLLHCNVRQSRCCGGR